MRRACSRSARIRASVDFPTRSGPSITMCFGAYGPRCVFNARLAEDDSCVAILDGQEYSKGHSKAPPGYYPMFFTGTAKPQCERNNAKTKQQTARLSQQIGASPES